MKKIRLDAEALVVDSFEMPGDGGESATVHAYGPTHPMQTGDAAAWTCNAVQWSCVVICGYETHFYTYCGLPCGDTSPQYDTCWDTCNWP